MNRLQEKVLGFMDENDPVIFPEISLRKIFTTIYLSEEPISIQSIASITGLSLASVSNKAKELVHMGILQKHSKPGSRELFLKTNYSLSQVLQVHTEQKIRVIEEQQVHLKKLVEILSGSTKDRAQSLLDDSHRLIRAHQKLIEELKK